MKSLVETQYNTRYEPLKLKLAQKNEAKNLQAIYKVR